MAFFANKTVAVTGGCGFIGSHLVRRLRTLGASVIVIDRGVCGDAPRVQYVGHTLGTDNPKSLADILDGVDYVFHLAAEKHHPGKDP